ncbi:histidine phosphatase family protein [Flavobacterium sp. NRK F10]|uniref:SixA phosphatase family protein n=1 Tax=Flavobacterium sp. NRK F10 TaxID=2954931 RepID=UPI002090CF68|nr:histidine phosphatase family protein [Flavobacterium sp. NRK F10]MCO6176364.1 histidine phosphatase family protein [Flavobacterium sp. NRK F10]
MKNLVIIRHSKSSWETPLNDIDRPLSQRGIRDAHLVSDALLKYLPETYIAWSSVAKRAKETATIFSHHLQIPLDTIVLKDELYTFDESALEKAIKKCSNTYDNLILFGHNDAITKFVNKFGDRFIDNVPTSGVVLLEFDTDDWNDLKKGRTKKTVFPSHFKHEQHAS